MLGTIHDGGDTPMNDTLLRPQHLGAGLKIALALAGLSANKLASSANIGRSTLTLYLSGKRVPDARTLRRIARVIAEHGGLALDQLWVELGRLLDEPAQPVVEWRGSNPPAQP
jgi:transcriptional regulator with XRE-family HTH domain